MRVYGISASDNGPSYSTSSGFMQQNYNASAVTDSTLPGFSDSDVQNLNSSVVEHPSALSGISTVRPAASKDAATVELSQHCTVSRSLSNNPAMSINVSAVVSSSEHSKVDSNTIIDSSSVVLYGPSDVNLKTNSDASFKGLLEQGNAHMSSEFSYEESDINSVKHQARSVACDENGCNDNVNMYTSGNRRGATQSAPVKKSVFRTPTKFNPDEAHENDRLKTFKSPRRKW